MDLLARDPSGCLSLVEVKSGGAWDRGVISGAQRARLQRALTALSEDEPAVLAVVVVDGQDLELIEAPDL